MLGVKKCINYAIFEYMSTPGLLVLVMHGLVKCEDYDMLCKAVRFVWAITSGYECNSETMKGERLTRS